MTFARVAISKTSRNTSEGSRVALKRLRISIEKQVHVANGLKKAYGAVKIIEIDVMRESLR